jgi:ankyrin repeat protein
MHKVTHNTRKRLTSLTDERLQAIIPQLNEFFLNSTQSPDILYALFEQYYPLSSINESIIYLYSISLYKPMICKLLDRIIEYLHLNNDENLYKFNEQTDNCNLLHNSIIKNYENIFQLLLKCGFNPNSLLSNHKTPLSIAVVTNSIHPIKRLEYIQLLIAYGANAITRDDVNVSPFKRLCGMGRFA